MLTIALAVIGMDTGAADNDDGTALARAVHERPAGKDASSRVLMLLSRDGAPASRRLLYMFTKEQGANERWTLIRFVEPGNVEGTGLLTLDRAGDDSDQWLYLPALKKARRIASSRKGGRFVGSDFYYEDLMDREVAMDDHRIIGQDKVGGLDCTLLESTPVDPSNSVYTKRVSCVHADLLIPLRIDFHQGPGEEPTKRLQAQKIKKVQGYWTVFDSTMYDLKSGSSTKLLTTDIVFDRGLPDSLFSRRALVDDSRDIPYRPTTE